jgi:hypothetical protein
MRGWVAAAVCCVAIGCATGYQPRSSERISLVIRGVSPMYAKGSRVSPVGVFHDDLEALVEDTPAAVPHARAGRRAMAAGTPTYLAGVGVLAVGIFVLSGPVGWTIIGMGAATTGTGLALLGKGTAQKVDAMNIHNDQVGAPSVSQASSR